MLNYIFKMDNMNSVVLTEIYFSNIVIPGIVQDLLDIEGLQSLCHPLSDASIPEDAHGLPKHRRAGVLSQGATEQVLPGAISKGSLK